MAGPLIVVKEMVISKSPERSRAHGPIDPNETISAKKFDDLLAQIDLPESTSNVAGDGFWFLMADVEFACSADRSRPLRFLLEQSQADASISCEPKIVATRPVDSVGGNGHIATYLVARKSLESLLGAFSVLAECAQYIRRTGETATYGELMRAAAGEKRDNKILEAVADTINVVSIRIRKPLPKPKSPVIVRLRGEPVSTEELLRKTGFDAQEAVPVGDSAWRVDPEALEIIEREYPFSVTS